MSTLFDKIDEQYQKKLPFVVYNKPDSGELNVVFQTDDSLDFIESFDESGFVFCDFEGLQQIVFKLEKSKFFTEKYDFINFDSGQNKIFDNNEDSKKNHIKLVQKGIAAIKKSEFKKVVLSRKENLLVDDFNFIFTFKKLLNKNKTAFTYLWYHPKIGMWMGAFAEQLVKIFDNSLQTMSLAGTQLFETNKTVFWQEKEINEQKIVTEFIVESLKNEAISIDVTKPKTIKSGVVVHLRTDIKAVLKPEYSLKKIVDHLHPTPAVCGFPKLISKNFILKNEKYDREFYSGFLGELNVIQKDNTKITDLFVNLRCMKIDKNEVAVYVGGGITADSQPANEWLETVNKSRAIKSVLT